MTFPTPKVSTLFFVGLISASLVACDEKDDDDDGDDGTTDGGATDGGAGDGGGGDGGGGDGGGDGGSEVDTGILLVGYAGQANVTPSAYDGFEDVYYIGFAGNLECVITSDLAGNGLDVAPCSACEWAFSVTTSGSTLSSDVGCSLIGVDASAASGYDGATYNYGYQGDYVGYYGDVVGVLQYYFSGYGWYAVAYADYAGGTFTYDWPSGYYYYYL